MISKKEIFIRSWSFIGISFIFLSGIFRLYPKIEPLVDYRYDLVSLILSLLLVVSLVYLKGYLVLQKRFLVRSMMRIERLCYQNNSWIDYLLAPLYSLFFYRGSIREMAPTYLMAIFIAIFSLYSNEIDAWWRGVVCLAVSISLFWSLIFLFFSSVLAPLKGVNRA